jgi:hypothetical protein
MGMGHKKQHFVPRSYLKAWHDETVPMGPKHTPYVWCFDRDGSNPRKKSPANLFTETDIYTLHRKDGSRDLRFEHGFSGVEQKFAELRVHFLNGRQWPKLEGVAYLLAFAAIARFRTPAFRDHHRRQWGGIYDRMKAMETAFNAATPEKKKAMASMPHIGVQGRGMDMAQVAQLRDYPIQTAAPVMLKALLEGYSKMGVAILCTDDPVGFVTSDHPCVWADPAAHERPFMLQGVGLEWPTVEVTMPISPSQCLLLTHTDKYQGFVDISDEALAYLNRRHIWECNETFVARRNEIHPEWFRG